CPEHFRRTCRGGNSPERSISPGVARQGVDRRGCGRPARLRRDESSGVRREEPKIAAQLPVSFGSSSPATPLRLVSRRLSNDSPPSCDRLGEFKTSFTIATSLAPTKGFCRKAHP